MNFRKIKQQLHKDIKTAQGNIDILNSELNKAHDFLTTSGLEESQHNKNQVILNLSDYHRIASQELIRLNIELVAVRIMQARTIKERLIDEGWFGHRINLCDQYILDRGIELRDYLDNNF